MNQCPRYNPHTLNNSINLIKKLNESDNRAALEKCMNYDASCNPNVNACNRMRLKDAQTFQRGASYPAGKSYRTMLLEKLVSKPSVESQNLVGEYINVNMDPQAQEDSDDTEQNAYHNCQAYYSPSTQQQMHQMQLAQQTQLTQSPPSPLQAYNVRRYPSNTDYQVPPMNFNQMQNSYAISECEPVRKTASSTPSQNMFQNQAECYNVSRTPTNYQPRSTSPTDFETNNLNVAHQTAKVASGEIKQCRKCKKRGSRSNQESPERSKQNGTPRFNPNCPCSNIFRLHSILHRPGTDQVSQPRSILRTPSDINIPDKQSEMMNESINPFNDSLQMTNFEEKDPFEEQMNSLEWTEANVPKTEKKKKDKCKKHEEDFHACHRQFEPFRMCHCTNDHCHRACENCGSNSKVSSILKDKMKKGKSKTVRLETPDEAIARRVLSSWEMNHSMHNTLQPEY